MFSGLNQIKSNSFILNGSRGIKPPTLELAVPCCIHSAVDRIGAAINNRYTEDFGLKEQFVSLGFVLTTCCLFTLLFRIL